MEYKTIYTGGDTEVRDTGGIIKSKGVVTIALDLEYNTDKIQNSNIENVYYFYGSPKLFIRPDK